jgi:hypothetical protein
MSRKKADKPEVPQFPKTKRELQKDIIKGRNRLPAKQKTPAKAKAKKPGGRKPWVPDYEIVEKYAALGLLDKEIAALTGVTHQVFCQKKTELPELAVALERGRAKGVQIASAKMWEGINRGDKDLIKFFLSRRGGYVEKVEVATEPKDISQMTVEELLARREEIIASRRT